MKYNLTQYEHSHWNRELDREEEQALKREEKGCRERLVGSIWARQRLDPLAEVCGGGESGHDLAATILEIQHGLDLGALGRKSAAGRATLIPSPTASGLIQPNQTDQTNLLEGHTLPPRHTRPDALARISHEFRRPRGVAQTSPGLPGYRGFPIRSFDQPGKACRLEVGDTAGWKPAPRSLGSPVPPLGCEMSALGAVTKQP